MTESLQSDSKEKKVREEAKDRLGTPGSTLIL